MSSVYKASLLMMLAIALTACGSGIATSTPVDAASISTAMVATLVASAFQAQTMSAPAMALPTFPSQVPTVYTIYSFPTSASQTATFAYYPTVALITPSVTGTVYTPTTDPSSLAYGCNNLAFVRDVTVPSGTVFGPGDDVFKTWKVANTGTCNWMYQYELVLSGGNAFDGITTKLNKMVTVGHWAEVSVDLNAPKSAGTYTAYWRLADPNGNMFGDSLMVSFEVSTSPTDTPEPPTAADTPTSTVAPTPTDTPTDTPTP